MISKTQHETLPQPYAPRVVMSGIYVQSERFQWLSTLLEGGGRASKIRNGSATKLMGIGYGYPEHKCTHCKRYFRICPKKYWPELYFV